MSDKAQLPFRDNVSVYIDVKISQEESWSNVVTIASKREEIKGRMSIPEAVTEFRKLLEGIETSIKAQTGMFESKSIQEVVNV